MSLDLSQYEAVLLDLDGTVYHEDHALPGAVELIRRLQERGRKYACLTNSTSSPERLTQRLAGMGVQVDPAHIYTAASAAADYATERFADVPNGKPRIFNLATEGIHEMLDGKVRWVEAESDPCDAVICGVPLSVFATDERRRTAMLLLRQAQRWWPSALTAFTLVLRGLEFGVGALSAMLAYAANVQPVYCGKPEPLFFHELCHRLNVEPSRCVLIGDNPESDIAGGKAVGMRTILTLSGIINSEDLPAIPQVRRADAVIEDLRELLRVPI